jgi:hypothetical protein
MPAADERRETDTERGDTRAPAAEAVPARLPETPAEAAQEVGATAASKEKPAATKATPAAASSPPAPLRTAISESEELLQYTVRHGIAVPDELLNTIVSGVRAANPESWDTPTTVKFWKAAQELAKLVHPVTPESIKAAETRKKPARPSLTTFYYGLFLVFFLSALIVVQIYWVIGSNLVDRISALTAPPPGAPAAAGAAESAGAPSVIAAPVAAAQVQAGSSREIYADFILLDHWYSQIAYSWTTQPGWLGRWFNSEGENKRIEHAIVEEAEYHRQLLLGASRAQLNFLAQYILPLLYGLIGATAFVLRSLSHEIETLTFSGASTTRYNLRIVLGMLSGISVGLILTQKNIPASLQAITPLGLAFLVGYSVELLFAAMDRLIAAFTDTTRTAPK